MSGATLPQTASENHPQHSSRALERLFADCFEGEYDTLLRGGAEEPFYQACRAGAPAVIHYRFDYFRSALHEIAHWCVAGEARRQQDDYGYWYAPDGRSAAQQKEFEQVEVLPQAWELLFCAAAGVAFRVSMDNLENAPAQVGEFQHAVLERATALLESGPKNQRGWPFTLALARQFRGEGVFRQDWLRDSFVPWQIC